ncbi:MAG: two-component system sensor histidine kinase CreC [Desulfofustis sp.]|nr:two-component system sensor histidine kinase CreC [Desulfofustis sp.]
MKVGTRIFFCYLLISTVCLYFPFDWVLDTMRTRYLEGVEDPLVDQANIFAAAIEEQMIAGDLRPEQWQAVFDRVRLRPLAARIYDLDKDRVDSLLYITDHNGIVIFHSADPGEIGMDYSRWRDVQLTLQGRYGARTSQAVVDGLDASVLYVAAPIRFDDAVVGVVAVGKPTTNISWFVENAKLKIVSIALLALAVAAFLAFLVSQWLTRPINRLTGYAREIAAGGHPHLPSLGRSEIGVLGQAFEQMREALEGKRYVEQYIQNLTHEIKSPLSAIRGAAELLAEPMSEEQRLRFIMNIRTESSRIQTIVDRMLELAALESRKKLVRSESVIVKALVSTVVEALMPIAEAKGIVLETRLDDGIKSVDGDLFLLHQALSNLLRNAIDFSDRAGRVELIVEPSPAGVRFRIVDEGCGIEVYAVDRVFEKFFSLQRPDSGKKSTGLGLNFVQQIALLHGGTVHLANREQGGVEAVFELPLNPQ